MVCVRHPTCTKLILNLLPSSPVLQVETKKKKCHCQKASDWPVSGPEVWGLLVVIGAKATLERDASGEEGHKCHPSTREWPYTAVP